MFAFFRIIFVYITTYALCPKNYKVIHHSNFLESHSFYVVIYPNNFLRGKFSTIEFLSFIGPLPI